MTINDVYIRTIEDLENSLHLKSLGNYRKDGNKGFDTIIKAVFDQVMNGGQNA